MVKGRLVEMWEKGSRLAGKGEWVRKVTRVKNW